MGKPKRRPTPVQIVRFAPKRRQTPTLPLVRTTTEEMPLADEPTELQRIMTPDTVLITSDMLPGDEPKKKKHQTQHNMSYLTELGHTLFTQGRVHEARAVFEGLVATNANDAFAHTMLGTISLSLGQYPRALELFERALKLEPNDVAALVYRGEIRLKHKKLKSAASDFKRAIPLGDPSDAFITRAKRLLDMARRAGREKNSNLR